MPELVLLTLERRDIDLWKRADAAAAAAVMWADYEGKSLACFVCDGQVDRHPPPTMFLPEPSDFARVVALPLCGTCWGKGPQVRLNRCLAVLRAMHKSRTGKQFHIQSPRSHW